MLRRDPDVVLPGRPLQLDRLCGAQRPVGVPLADAQEDPLAVIRRQATASAASFPSSTPNRTRPPSEARRCTWEAIGTVSLPANSSGSRNREYCEGIPASGSASTEPACHSTPASASDSWRRYQTAFPSRSSTACTAPAFSPPCPRSLILTLIFTSRPADAAADAAPHGRAGPTRSRVPWRSGGKEPDIGRGRAPLSPITGSTGSHGSHGSHGSRGSPAHAHDMAGR